jgi:SAM-dependent methyltransferase
MILSLRRLILFAALAFSLSAQTDDYSFYTAFRAWMQQTSPATLRAVDGATAGAQARIDAVVDQYAEKLRTEGVAAPEIERRKLLLRTKRQELENYFWNQTLTNPDARFNKDANAFLVEMTKGRKPGAALDMGAGEGRNSVYLASQGWQVTAVDPADQALALGLKRAKAAGNSFQTVVATDTEFDFGHNQWQVILYSWMNPVRSAAKVVESLAPGGVVIFEGAQEWAGTNGLLKMFPSLRVLHYEDIQTKSDFFGRREMQVVRYCAQKGN